MTSREALPRHTSSGAPTATRPQYFLAVALAMSGESLSYGPLGSFGEPSVGLTSPRGRKVLNDHVVPPRRSPSSMATHAVTQGDSLAANFGLGWFWSGEAADRRYRASFEDGGRFIGNFGQRCAFTSRGQAPFARSFLFDPQTM